MSLSWTVVVTTRNRANMLRRALKSSVNQTFPCEVVVIDDASVDETPQVVKEFPTVRYIRNPAPVGQSAAENIGIKAATGEWIKPLDDDDWLHQNCVEVMTNLLRMGQAHGFAPTLISGTAINMSEKETELVSKPAASSAPTGLKSRELLRLMMLDQAHIGTPLQVGHSRQAALEVGGWNENPPFTHAHGNDTELWVKLAACGDAIFTPQLVGYRTVWPGSMSRQISHYDRYLANLYIKDLIAERLGEPTPQAVKSYLALHWALVAAKDRDLGAFTRLAREWLRHPASISMLQKKQIMRDAQRHFASIPEADSTNIHKGDAGIATKGESLNDPSKPRH